MSAALCIALVVFQFLIGSLGTPPRFCSSSPKDCFNSLQVVQVQEHTLQCLQRSQVSIPYRQSRYKDEIAKNRFLKEFQFLIGSLGTLVSSFTMMAKICFNSLQVVQVQSMQTVHGTSTDVSIPYRQSRYLMAYILGQWADRCFNSLQVVQVLSTYYHLHHVYNCFNSLQVVQVRYIMLVEA